MKRTKQTASNIDAPQERWKALNEIDAVSLDDFLAMRAIAIFRELEIKYKKEVKVYWSNSTIEYYFYAGSCAISR